jgi:glyoxylase-like metal-dependent hydrolase (beta-lactamase superfamily II)
MKKKILFGLGIVIVILITVFFIFYYPTYRFFTHKDVIQIDKNLTIVIGGGGNSCLLVGDSAVLVVDTKMMSNAEDLYKMAQEKAGKKPIIVVNTHYHPDHVKGNKFYKNDKIYIGNYDKTFLEKNVDADCQPNTFGKDSLILNLGNEIVELYNLGQAHTFDDMVVYLKNRKILFSGDLIFYEVNPVLKKESGADVDKWISVLNLLTTRWGDARIVPGHGKIGGKELMASLKQYFEDLKIAADQPSKESEMKAKYDNWTKISSLASPFMTIEYLKTK